MTKSLWGSKALRVASAVLVIQGALFYSASRGFITPVAAPLSAFPGQVGPWKLYQEGTIDQETLDILKADDVLTRWYVSPVGGANLFLAYFSSQRTGQSPHSPKNCLPGSGWQPSESSKVDAPVEGGAPIRINKYIVAKGDEQSVVLYWYQSHGRVIADEFAAKFYLVADSIRTHRSDTALVRVVVPVIKGDTQHAVDTGMDFVKSMYPAVRAYLPG
jgi:EpsI family protein